MGTNRDMVFKVINTNRFTEVPEDILVPASQNVVDSKRQELGNFFKGNNKRPGVANYGHSVLKTIKRALDEGRLLISNKKLSSLGDNYFYSKYSGPEPSYRIYGDNNEFVEITLPENTNLELLKVQGLPLEVDASNRRTVIFKGKGLLGNTNINNIILPTVIIGSLTTSIIGPSTSAPWSVKSSDSGDFEIVGIGNEDMPSLSLRFNNIHTLTDQHLLQFFW